MKQPTRQFRFTHTHRLHGTKAFAAVYATRLQTRAGPLTVYGRPNGLSHPRLGLSVGKRIRPAAHRTRIKRMLREAFRLGQHDWPGGYDLVLVVRPHDLAPLAYYHRLILESAYSIHRHQQRLQRETNKE